jgi:hypothetical protein
MTGEVAGTGFRQFSKAAAVFIGADRAVAIRCDWGDFAAETAS